METSELAYGVQKKPILHMDLNSVTLFPTFSHLAEPTRPCFYFFTLNISVSQAFDQPTSPSLEETLAPFIPLAFPPTSPFSARVCAEPYDNFEKH